MCEICAKYYKIAISNRHSRCAICIDERWLIHGFPSNLCEGIPNHLGIAATWLKAKNIALQTIKPRGIKATNTAIP